MSVKIMAESHWTSFHRQWSRLGTPLRPNNEVAAAVERLIEGVAARMLLLGVTPELANLGEELIAVERNAAMIAALWKPHTLSRCAVRANWLALPFSPGCFSVAIGDGSLNSLNYPTGYAVAFGQLSRVVHASGLTIVRAYVTPDENESISEVCRAAASGEIRSFHAFKLRLAMAMVGEARQPNIAVTAIYKTFCATFRNRDALALQTRWPRNEIDTIDAYCESSEVYSFPTFAEIKDALPQEFSAPERVVAGSYELAERCPLIVIRRDCRGEVPKEIRPWRP